MPNHITNRLKVVGEKKEVLKVWEFIKVEDTEEVFPLGTIDFNKIIPMPENIYMGSLGKKERELYGENNWYDWSCSNWGTKWNAYHFHTGDLENDTIFFDTAWATVPTIIAKLSSIFPGLLFILDYADEDFGYNTGTMEFEDGKMINSDIKIGESDEAMEHAKEILGYDPYSDEETA